MVNSFQIYEFGAVRGEVPDLEVKSALYILLVDFRRYEKCLFKFTVTFRFKYLVGVFILSSLQQMLWFVV